MALTLNNRVRETTSTTGTGAVTFAGAVDGFQTFAAGIGNSNTTYYAISLNSANEWEVGLGTLNGDSSTLTRTTVLESSNSDSAVDFSAGSKEIFCTLPSEKALYLDASDDLANSGVVTNTSVDASAAIALSKLATVTGSRVLESTSGGAISASSVTATTLGYLDATSSIQTQLDAKLTNVVDDTTPQLGGDLDVNGNAIVSASDGAIAINADGTGTVTMTTNSVTGDVIPGKLEGTNFTDSLLVGHSTTGTLDAAADNTGVGIDALPALTTGDKNTAIGSGAGLLITSGANNTLVGFNAGDAITTTAGNTIMGKAAGSAMTGSYTTGVGFNNLTVATGSYNTSFGAYAGDSIVGGSRNICFGYQAGQNLTTGDGNVIIGNVDAASATDDVQLKISGYDGTTTANWISGDSSGNVTFAGTATANGSLLATQGDVTALAVALG